MWEKLKNEFIEGRTLLQFGFLQTVGMIIPLIIAKFFSEEMWGQYTLGEMIVYFFVTFIACPRIPFIVYANQERIQTGKISRSLSVQFVFVGVVFAFFLLSCVFFRGFLMKLTGIDWLGLLCVALAFFGLSFKDVISSLFMGLNERIKSAFVEPAYGILALIIICVLYFAGLMDFKSIFLTYFVSSVVVCLVCLRFVNFKLVRPLGLDKEYFSQMGWFTLWMVLGIGMAYFIDWSGVYFLSKYATLTNSGTFNFANKFFKGFMALVYMLPNYFLPLISESLNNPSRIRYYLYHKRPVIFLLGVMVLIVAFFVIPYFITFIYRDKFQDAIPIARIQLLAVVVFLYTAFYFPLIGAMKRYKFVQIVTAIQGVLSISLNLMLIPRMGTYGAAIATVISYVFLLFAYEGYFQLKLAKILMPKQG